MSNSFFHEASKMFWHFQLVFRYYNKSQGNDFTKPLKEAHNLFLYAAAEQSGYSLLPPPVGQELIPSLKQSMQSTAQKPQKKEDVSPLDCTTSMALNSLLGSVVAGSSGWRGN